MAAFRPMLVGTSGKKSGSPSAMAGTDRTRAPLLGGPAIILPAIILVEPQLGENIGAAARAMLNFGLTDLRLVRPRDGWPNAKAAAAASGADVVLDRARAFETAEDAIADLQHLWAATARRRGMLKTAVTAERAALDMRGAAAAGESSGVLFGPERAGLTNDDVSLADCLLTVPLNPAYASLNLAQAVLLVAYEWFRAGDATPAARLEEGRTRLANKDELVGFFEHLEHELDASGFLFVAEKRPSMVRNIRGMFQRAGLMEQEVRTLRGIVTALAGRRGPVEPR